MNIWQRWLTQPKFSLKLFISGLLPFFTGVGVAYLSIQEIIQQMNLGWVLIIIGIVIALPGYIGIWRWRWIKFKND